MDADELYRRYRSKLIGRRISFVRLACNSLLLYVECEPGDGQGLTFWFEPIWHLTGPEGLITSSYQARGAGDDGPTAEELDRVSTPFWENLVNQPITDIQVDQRTRDLTLIVANSFYVKTFATDPEDDHSWHIRENSTGVWVLVSPTGMRIYIGTN